MDHFSQTFSRNIPHISKKIFVDYLGYTDFKNCLFVSKKWRKIITEHILNNAKSQSVVKSKRLSYLWMQPSNHQVKEITCGPICKSTIATHKNQLIVANATGPGENDLRVVTFDEQGETVNANTICHPESVGSINPIGTSIVLYSSSGMWPRTVTYLDSDTLHITRRDESGTPYGPTTFFHPDEGMFHFKLENDIQYINSAFQTHKIISALDNRVVCDVDLAGDDKAHVTEDQVFVCSRSDKILIAYEKWSGDEMWRTDLDMGPDFHPDATTIETKGGLVYVILSGRYYFGDEDRPENIGVNTLVYLCKAKSGAMVKSFAINALSGPKTSNQLRNWASSDAFFAYLVWNGDETEPGYKVAMTLNVLNLETLRTDSFDLDLHKDVNSVHITLKFVCDTVLLAMINHEDQRKMTRLRLYDLSRDKIPPGLEVEAVPSKSECELREAGYGYRIEVLPYSDTSVAILKHSLSILYLKEDDLDLDSF